MRYLNLTFLEYMLYKMECSDSRTRKFYTKKYKWTEICAQ